MKSRILDSQNPDSKVGQTEDEVPARQSPGAEEQRHCMVRGETRPGDAEPPESEQLLLSELTSLTPQFCAYMS